MKFLFVVFAIVAVAAAFPEEQIRERRGIIGAPLVSTIVNPAVVSPGLIASPAIVAAPALGHAAPLALVGGGLPLGIKTIG